MAKRVGVDKWLFGVTVLLTFIGLLDDLQRLRRHGRRPLWFTL